MLRGPGGWDTVERPKQGVEGLGRLLTWQEMSFREPDMVWRWSAREFRGSKRVLRRPDTAIIGSGRVFNVSGRMFIESERVLRGPGILLRGQGRVLRG